MDKEILDRLEKIEKKLSDKKRDVWEKLQLLTPILIPISIALAGWYFTNQHNKNQLELQESNNNNQLQVALINSNVGQSELIKDFMQHLTSKDTAVRNIAIEAILYAAPTPGKRIVDIIARTSPDINARFVANDALEGKRRDLVSNLFSVQKQARIIAANEITSSWTTDAQLLKDLVTAAGSCLSDKNYAPDCENGVFNAISVLSGFSTDLLANKKEDIKNLIAKIPSSSQLTRNQSNELLKKLE